MNYKIEKDIPITKTKKENDKFPFSQMEVGDSFLIECKDAQELLKQRMLVCNYFKKYIIHNNLNWEYCTRKQDDYNLRVWRTN